MSSFTIPASLEEAARRLNEIGELLDSPVSRTQRNDLEWERAAIVAAWVRLDEEVEQ